MNFKRILWLVVLVCCLFVMSSCDDIEGMIDDILLKLGLGEPETCEHAWVDASCTLPKTCELCGETEGEPNGHGGGLATCTDKAICLGCGEEYGEIDPEVHSGAEVWFKHLYTHGKGYQCCGVVTAENEEHSKVGGVCTVCGFDPVISFSEAVISEDGTKAEVIIVVSDNPGIIGLELGLSFGGGMTLSSVESGDAMAALAFTAPSDYSEGGTFLWDGIDMQDKDVKNGNILKLTFDISEANIGEHKIILSVKAYDSELNLLSFKIGSGSVTVIRNKVETEKENNDVGF